MPMRGERLLILRHVSMPPIPGILISSNTISPGLSRRTISDSSPLRASETSNPLAASDVRSARRNAGSSSTIRTLQFSLGKRRLTFRKRQSQTEGHAVPCGIHQRQVASMGQRDLARDVQPEAGTRGGSLGIVTPVKPVEDAALLVRRNGVAVIPDIDRGGVLAGRELDQDSRIRPRILTRVFQELADCQAHQFGIHPHVARLAIFVELDPAVGPELRITDRGFRSE